jgi:tetratricopeptide (TPR) repeat protein
LKQNLAEIKKGQMAAQQAQSTVAAVEARYNTNPTDLNVAFELASMYLSLQRTNEANLVLERLVEQPNADAKTLLSVAHAYSQLQNMVGMEAALSKLVKVMPEHAEAWYDLSRAQTVTRKIPEALQSLRNAVILSNKRLATNSAAKNLAVEAPNDPSFAPIRNLPEFARALSPQEP